MPGHCSFIFFRMPLSISVAFATRPLRVLDGLCTIGAGIAFLHLQLNVAEVRWGLVRNDQDMVRHGVTHYALEAAKWLDA